MTTHDHDQPMCEARVSDDSGVGLHPCSGRVAEYRANMKYIEADAMLEARKPSA